MKTKKSSAAFCVPRVKTNSRSTTTTGEREISVTPMTLLERFREAVLRLIMISAASNSKSTTSRRFNFNKQPAPKSGSHKYYNPNDPFHTEAMADCIEFIRTKKAIDR